MDNSQPFNDNHEEYEYEQYVEAEGEQIYLVDEVDAIAPLPVIAPVHVELETSLELTVLPDNDHIVLYDPDNPRIELNALFPDVDAFRKSLRHFAIKTDFEYTTLKSDKTRFTAKCAYKGCPWRIRAYRIRDDNKTFKPAAHAYTIEQCEYHLNEMKEASPAAIKYLEKHSLWCRSKFSKASKVDYVTNNISESFNNWIKDLKDLHVIEMLNQIRRKIMVTFDMRRLVGTKIDGKIVPSVMKELNEKSRHPETRRMTVSRANDTCAEVSGTTRCKNWTHVVQIDKQQCSCGEWQLCGKPCSHAVAFICTLRQFKLEDFVHEYYSIERFRKAYEGVIMHIGDTSKWVKSDPGFTVWPPIMKRTSGRPRKERIPSSLELGARRHQCKRCKRMGHQARTCKEAVDDLDANSTRTRKRKKRAKGATAVPT